MRVCVCVVISLLGQPELFKCEREAMVLSAHVIDALNSQNSFERPENSSIQLHHGLLMEVVVAPLRGFRGGSRHLIPHHLRTLIDGHRRLASAVRMERFAAAACCE